MYRSSVLTVTARLWVLIALSLAFTSRSSGEFRLLSQIDISNYIEEPETLLATGKHSVFAVEFSPDGTALAVATGLHDTARGPFVHLFVMSVPGQKKIFATTIKTSRVRGLRWSIDGKYLLVHTSDGSYSIDPIRAVSCEVRENSVGSAGFSSPETFFVVHNFLTTSSLRIYDTSCKFISEVNVPARFSYVDTSASLGLIIASDEHGDIRVLHSATWDTSVMRSGIGLTPRTPFVPLVLKIFGLGTGFCGAPEPGTLDGTLRCWALDPAGPRKLASPDPQKRKAKPVAAATRVPWIAYLDVAFSYNSFTERRKLDFKRWVIWDALEGRMVDQLAVKLQGRRYPVEGRTDYRVPYEAALSATGSFFAIGGENTVEIYQLEHF